jgi:hypothetical protein
MGKGDTHTKKHGQNTKSKFIKYELEIANKSEGEFYAKVLGMLGGNRIKVIDLKGCEIQATVRGNFYFGGKKENLNFSDADKKEYYVLIQPGISKNQYFLKHIYNETDIKKLYDKGELLASTTQTNVITVNENNDIVATEKVDNEDWLDNL